MEKLGTIYKIINLTNGKSYVGQTIGDGFNRWRAHLYRLRKNIHANHYLQNAFNKNGEKNFSFKIVCKCPLDKLDEIEIKEIAKYKKDGTSYNIEDGGKFNKVMGDSAREKMRRMMIKRHREDTKYRQEYLKFRARKIICLNNMKVYESIKDAGKELGLKADRIDQVLYGNNKYAKGENGVLYQFEYYSIGKKYELKNVRENIRTAKRKIVCVNTGEVFNHSKEASFKHNVSSHGIMRCCRGERRYAGRMPNGDWISWRFLSEYDENEKLTFRKTGENSNRAKPIICITTGEFFSTSKQACDKYNLGSGNLSQTLKGKRKWCGSLEDGRKLTWKYA